MTSVPGVDILVLVGVVDGENFDFMFYKKLIMTTANDNDYGVRKIICSGDDVYMAGINTNSRQ